MTPTAYVFAATTPWTARPLTEHHLALALARAGHRVLFVEPPASLGRPGAAAAARRPLHHDRGVDVLSPVCLPWRDRAAGWPVSRPLVAGQIRRAVRRCGLGAPVLVTFATHRDLGGRLGERGRVAYLKDAAGPAAALIGLPAERLERTTRDVVAGAQLVVTPSPLLAAEVASTAATPVLELAPGCDPAPFAAEPAPHPALAALPHPRLGVVGTLNDRIDWPLLEHLADAWPAASLVLVGPRSRTGGSALDRLAARPNVTETGPVPHDELPAVLASLDAGLVPYTRSAFNLRSTPLKAVEYLAAGLPVVSTDLPAMAALDPRPAIAADADTFAAAARGAVAADTPERRRARREAAGAHTWDARARVLAARIDEAVR